jgi:hypothetical protein
VAAGRVDDAGLCGTRRSGHGVRVSDLMVKLASRFLPFPSQQVDLGSLGALGVRYCVVACWGCWASCRGRPGLAVRGKTKLEKGLSHQKLGDQMEIKPAGYNATTWW